MSMLGVVYLARGCNGPEPLQRFLDSYRTHFAGTDHSLHAAFKGYGDEAALSRDEGMVKRVGAVPLFLTRDDQMDIGAYREIAQKIQTDWLVFLNSFSVILADGWLAQLSEAVRRPGVGLAGATGSWESQATNAFHLIAQLRRPRDVARWAYKRWYSPPFPNPHIRSNAFIIRRDLFCELSIPDTSRKQYAYAFESGRHSMTRQIQGRGLRPVVVGREGVFEIADWPSSAVYCSGEQANLLVADNRTRAYAEASPESRRELSFRAWGAGRQ